MKTKLLGALATAMLVATACGGTPAAAPAAGGGAGATASRSPIVIAAVTDTTGSFVLIGADVLKGVQLGVKDINARGGVAGHPIDLKVYDAGNSNDTAVNAMQQALGSKPVAGIGLPVSTQGFAVSQLLKQSNLPFVMAGCATGLTQQHIRAIFVACPENNVNTEAAARFAIQTLKAKRIAIVYTDESYGQEGDKDFQKEIPALGGTIVAQEPEQMSDTNFTAQMTRVAAAKPDVIIVWDQQNPMILTDQEIHQLGIHAKVINSILIPASVKLLTPAEADGIYAAGQLPASKPNDPAFTDFVKQVEAAYHTAPDGYTAMGFDGMHMLAQAIATVGTDPAKIESYLLGMKSYAGVYGTYTPWPDGSLMHTSPIARYENGAFQFTTAIQVAQS